MSSIGLLSDALIFVLDVVPSVSSTDPNLEIVPLSTNRCGICPDASQELENEKRIMKTYYYHLIRLNIS
jgi:hypothetical protein